MIIGLVSVIMIFGIPIVAIITSHLSSQTELKAKIIEDQIKLEELKHQNYLLETDKMRRELEAQLKLEDKKLV
ncbi:hypothetical protein [Cytobacillus kochii]|uniref:hypothetical protein n=1 Tax=Cytobacillus kochii TaxID=859143 RepID=UPI00255A2EA6|nr:hypothetical protein [Cytobacillus kochii]